MKLEYRLPGPSQSKSDDPGVGAKHPRRIRGDFPALDRVVLGEVI